VVPGHAFSGIIAWLLMMIHEVLEKDRDQSTDCNNNTSLQSVFTKVRTDPGTGNEPAIIHFVGTLHHPRQRKRNANRTQI
jgi:hypothetical protein